ncbi:hypothetical protein BASA83_007395 [Batrachochytrium salamandrivorans]|nr:hypothetical protein BASA83_007395 [Batrachochytrium salamandrivorans]
MKKDLKDYYLPDAPNAQLNRSASRTHAPLPIRPVPPVALPFERWGIDFYGPMVETKSGTDKRDRWDEYLPQVLLAIRTRTHAVTGYSPFYLLFGTHPRLPNDETPPRSSLMPLDEIERMEENSEFIARNLEEVGQARSAANVRTKAQAEAMRKRNNFDENTSDYYFKVGDMVKMKHHDRQKLEFNWKGPYHVVDVGHPGTYWIMTPQGLRLPNAVNQVDLAPWLAPVIDNVDFSMMGLTETHLWIRKGLV